jgi:nucleotide-binding universal stress UspA family protein
MINRMLVPVDTSREGSGAADYAVWLASSFQAGVTLLHVVEELRLPMYVPGIYPTDREKYRQSLLQEGKLILEFMRIRFLRAGITADTELREGSPGKVIVEVAALGSYDIIVIGSSEPESVQDVLIGGVSNYVARNASCPVLIVRGEWPGKSMWGWEADIG